MRQLDIDMEGSEVQSHKTVIPATWEAEEESNQGSTIMGQVRICQKQKQYSVGHVYFKYLYCLLV